MKPDLHRGPPTVVDVLKDAATATPVKRYVNAVVKSLTAHLGCSRTIERSQALPVEFADSAGAIPTFEEFDARLRRMAQWPDNVAPPPKAVIELTVDGRPLDLYVAWAPVQSGPSITLRLEQPGPLKRSPGDPVNPRIIYDARYDVGLFGLERLHPFDTHKYSRAYRVLEQQFGDRLWQATSVLFRPVSEEELLAVHSAQYLQRLKDRSYVAGALEMPPLRRLPGWVIDWRVLRPMRWAAAGTVDAAREAVRTGLAVNMSGGYHHASRDRGEGFCVYSDIALAVHELRRVSRLCDDDRVVYVDLDAHQGNGVCHEFFDDHRVFIFDAYNQAIYPASDAKAKRRIDCPVPLPDGCHEADYLAAVRAKLPPFLDAVTRGGRVGLAIYNAGTDIYRGDALGGMNVSADGVLTRDRFVIDQLVSRGLPLLILPSGGYSRESYQLLANMVAHVLAR